MAVDIRLLGAVEVLLDGRPVDVGHARQRCVLVALLAEPGQPVPADVVLDRVWADHPPRRGRDALSGYVSRLRHALAATGEVDIVRHQGGYLLRADPDAVDLVRFRRLMAEAR